MEKPPLSELAELVGRKQALVERLRRHAARCTYPAIEARVSSLADKEADHFDRLRKLLLDRGASPRPPQSESGEGANNWERLSRDLILLSAIASGLRVCAIRWESLDTAAARLMTTIAGEDLEHESELRKIVLRCDSMALD